MISRILSFSVRARWLVVALTAIVGLLGRILSDFCYVLVDPRINFGKEA